PACHVHIRAANGVPRGVSFLVKYPGSESIAAGEVAERKLTRWQQMAVLACKGTKARFYELEPAPGMNSTVELDGYFVRGAFKLARVENNAARAGRAFEEFHVS